MKKTFLVFFSIFVPIILIAQEIQHEAVAVNVEVPVRVFKGDTFIDNLTIDDFEVYEDGVLQNIEVVYLVKKKDIQREEAKMDKELARERFSPQTSRNFYLIFEISEYTPRIEEAIDYFIHNVLVPGDDLKIVTPKKTYRMRGELLENLPKEEVVSQLKSLVRKDTLTGNSEYRSAVNDLKVTARMLTAKMAGSSSDVAKLLDQSSSDMSDLGRMDIEVIINRYTTLLEKLEKLRRVDEQQLYDFANYLKEKEGQKYVFLFYQKEYIPQIESRILDQYLSYYQDSMSVVLDLSFLSHMTQREITFDVDRTKQAYADSSITINFLFFSKPARHTFGVKMVEHSEDIFGAFNEMAKATGGIVESSANPEFLFKKASTASENYYLLYYSPKNYAADGKFKEIKVKVKDKNYRVSHRSGYFASK
jgi:VWFA-related protein